jgi:hypothetical protein
MIEKSIQGVELLEMLSKSATPDDSLSNGMVLSLGATVGRHHLVFGGPRHLIIIKENTVARCRLLRVRTSCPVSIRVCCEKRDQDT